MYDSQTRQTHMDSSGYCLVVGDKCDKGKGVCKDEPASKPCSQGMSVGYCSVDMAKRCLKPNLQKGEITGQIVCIPVFIREIMTHGCKHEFAAEIMQYQIFSKSDVSVSSLCPLHPPPLMCTLLRDHRPLLSSYLLIRSGSPVTRDTSWDGSSPINDSLPDFSVYAPSWACSRSFTTLPSTRPTTFVAA